MFAMSQCRIRSSVVLVALTFLSAVLAAPPTRADDKKSDKLAEPITQGQRIFTCGHSFHVFVPGILTDLTAAG